MKHLVVLVEEQSMKEALDRILPRTILDRTGFVVISHEGKSDLERSFPRKMKGWSYPPDVRFMVLRDNDAGDCVSKKLYLVEKCKQATDRPFRARIVCQELESWFLGDMDALAASGLNARTSIARTRRKAKFRDPDRLQNPKQEIKNLLPSYQPIRGARAIAPHMDPERNRSKRFQVFRSALKGLVEE